MYYNAQSGVRQTWRENAQNILTEFRQHNWLPAAVGAIMVSWVALIIMGLQQTVLVNPPVADTTQVGDTGRTIDVTTAAVVTSSPQSSPVGSNRSSLAASNIDVQSPTTQQVATVTDVANQTVDEIGGRGGDEPTNPGGAVTDRLPVDPLPTDPTNDGGAIIVDPPDLPILDLPTLEVPLPALP